MSAYDSVFEAAPQPLEQLLLEPGCSDGIDFQALETGAIVHVYTKYSSYRLVAIDPESSAALITGGRLFSELTPVRVEGATAGGTAIKTGWIGVGLRLEVRNLTNRVTTSVVRSVTVEPSPASRVC